MDGFREMQCGGQSPGPAAGTGAGDACYGLKSSVLGGFAGRHLRGALGSEGGGGVVIKPEKVCRLVLPREDTGLGFQEEIIYIA